MSKKNIAFIGCGEIAGIHAHCLKQLDVNIAGGYDIDKNTAAEFTEKYGGKIYFSAEELTSDFEIDAIYICTRHDSHLKYIERAAANNLNIFCEKPLALNYEQAIKARQIIKNNNLKFALGFNHRYTPGITKLKKEIMKNNLDIDTMDISFVTAPFLKGWAATAEEGGGVLVCLGSHIFDLIYYLLGQEIHNIKVTALNTSLDEKKYLEDCFGALLQTEDNTLITINAHDRANIEYQVIRENMNMIKLFSGNNVYVVKGLTGLKIYYPDQVVDMKENSDFYRTWGYYDINKSFIYFLKGNKSNIPGIEAGVKTAELVERAGVEARTN